MVAQAAAPLAAAPGLRAVGLQLGRAGRPDLLGPGLPTLSAFGEPRPTGIAELRLVLLETAVKTITQRVNLFDKVLIPKTKSNIKDIKIYLSDEEMAAVVRSKISKRKRAAEARA